MLYEVITDQGRRVIASFRQNSLLRVTAGDEAEVVFTGVPGTVFKGKVKQVMPVVPEGVYQTQFALQTITFDGRNGILAEIELDPRITSYNVCYTKLLRLLSRGVGDELILLDSDRPKAERQAQDLADAAAFAARPVRIRAGDYQDLV